MKFNWNPMAMLHTIRTILKHIASTIIILVTIGAVGFAVFVQPGTLAIVVIIVPLCAWSLGMVWFLHFRQRVYTTTRRWVAVVLFVVFPIGFYFTWTNVHRLEQRHRDWLNYKSEHFVFHYTLDYPRSNEIVAFANTRDKVFEHNCAYLNVSLEDKIDFYIYDKLEEGFAVPDWNVIEADDDQSIGHEMTHIIAYHIAGERQNIKFLDEGIATWLNHTTRTKGHHEVAWELMQGGFPPLNELGNSRTFRHQEIPPYYLAASFIGYLIENYGINVFRRLWIANAKYPELYSIIEDLKLIRYFPFIQGERVHFESTVLEVYGRTLNDLDTEWRAWLKVRHGR